MSDKQLAALRRSGHIRLKNQPPFVMPWECKPMLIVFRPNDGREEKAIFQTNVQMHATRIVVHIMAPLGPIENADKGLVAGYLRLAMERVVCHARQVVFINKLGISCSLPGAVDHMIDMKFNRIKAFGDAGIYGSMYVGGQNAYT